MFEITIYYPTLNARFTTQGKHFDYCYIWSKISAVQHLGNINEPFRIYGKIIQSTVNK